jgi:xylulokinase
MSLVLGIDAGSTNLKVALYGPELELAADASVAVPLRVDGPCAEVDPGDWWKALRGAVPRVLASAGARPADVAAVAFCGAMQSVVLVDRALRPVRPALSYLDTRATALFDREMRQGWPRLSGVNARRLLASVRRTNIAPGSPKDPLWKVRWLMQHEPEAFARADKWLDVKDWLVARCTGRACTTADSAHLSCLYTFQGRDSRYSEPLCRLYGIDLALLPRVVPGDEVVGSLLPDAALELGLAPGTPVVPGGGDISCVALGAGAVEQGDTHVYLGTSGWVAQLTRRRLLDTGRYLAALRTCLTEDCLYMGELQTAGMCLTWARGLLARAGAVPEDEAALSAEAEQSPAGANGLLFAPWLHGSRSPNEDPHARGLLVNLSLTHRRCDVLRAVFEGVALHLAWILEGLEAKVPAAPRLRFVGGGARSPLWGQCLADATGRVVETVEAPQLCGARGAALLGLAATQPATDVMALARRLVPARSFTPNGEHRALYQSRRALLAQAHRANRSLFHALKAA